MNKINNALSNNVYKIGDKIRKEYINDSFKEMFKNQEDDGLIISDLSFNLGNGYIEMDYIEHKPWVNGEMTLEKNIEFIKWLRRFHDSQKLPSTMEYPGFYNSYLYVLNPAQGKFRKSVKWWPSEEGIFKDAMRILQEDKKVFLHNDLVEGNILITEDGYKLIDWEYGGVGNYLFDVASFVTERDLSIEDSNKIVKAYDPEINLDDFWIVASFLQAFWARWALYKFNSTQKEIYKEIYNWKIRKFSELTK